MTLPSPIRTSRCSATRSGALRYTVSTSSPAGTRARVRTRQAAVPRQDSRDLLTWDSNANSSPSTTTAMR